MFSLLNVYFLKFQFLRIKYYNYIGLSSDGMDLLEAYVDHTADVQTASLIALQGYPCLEIATDQRVHTWIESYRSLLDTWRLWHERWDIAGFCQ